MPNLKTASIAPQYPIVGKHDYWATYLLEQGKKAACTLKTKVQAAFDDLVLFTFIFRHQI